MPWEKSFSEDEVVKRATRVFWDKGYEAASISDLLEGMEINRGSFYNAFGGKRELFIRALKDYDEGFRRTVLADLEAMDDPKTAFQVFFKMVVDSTVADNEKKGCLLVNTTLELPAHDEEIHQLVGKAMGALESFFRRGIEVAQARGDMPKDIDPAKTASGLLALVVSIRVLGRGLFTEESLAAIAHQAERLVA